MDCPVMSEPYIDVDDAAVDQAHDFVLALFEHRGYPRLATMDTAELRRLVWALTMLSHTAISVVAKRTGADRSSALRTITESAKVTALEVNLARGDAPSPPTEAEGGDSSK